MNNDIKALKSSVWYTVSNFLVKSIGFITTPIFTRLLSKEEFGLYNNYTSWLSIITIFVTLNLESTFISARYDYEKELDTYILSVLSLSTFSAAIWFIVFGIFHTSLVRVIGLDNAYICIMLIYLVFLPPVHLFQARERYRFGYKMTVFISLLISIGTATLSLILVLVMGNRLLGRIIGAALPTILIGVILYLYFIKKGKRVSFSYWKYALPVCLPYIPHMLSMTVLNSTDRVMITWWCGEEDTAMYSLAYTCGVLINLFMTSMNNAYSPWLGEQLANGQYKKITQVSKLYMLLFLFLALGIMLVSPEILLVLGGKTYLEAQYVMAPVTMGCVCQFLYTMYVNVEQYKKKTGGMALASALAAFLNLFLNWIFIPKIGYFAAAYTTLLSYFFLLLFHMSLVKRLKLGEIFSYKCVFGVVLLGMVFMVAACFLYEMQTIRYIIILVYMIAGIYVVLRYRKKILVMLKK